MNSSQRSTVQKPLKSAIQHSGQTFFKIGDLAREFGISLRTLRFYEDKGLIKPGRSGTTRLYSKEDRKQLEIALFCKRIGMALDEIRQVLELHAQNAANSDQAEKIRQIYVAQLAQLQQQHRSTGTAIVDLKTTIAELAEG